MKLKLASILLTVAACIYLALAYTEHQGEAPLPADASVTLFGQVIQQGKYPLKQGDTLKGLILKAGGFAQFAATNKVKVINPNASGTALKSWLGSIVEQYNSAAEKLISHAPDFLSDFIPTFSTSWFNCRALVNLKAGEDLHLMNGDVIIVPEKAVIF